jgi:diaphanous 1
MVGNALNNATFRGGAQGFQLDALLKVIHLSLCLLRSDSFFQLKETKTARGGTGCPTLLHYLARVLLRTDPLLISFTDDIPHLDAAARGEFLSHYPEMQIKRFKIVSVQTVMQSASALVSGLSQLSEEIKQLKRLPSLPANDLFIVVMQVSTLPLSFMPRLSLDISPS